MKYIQSAIETRPLFKVIQFLVTTTVTLFNFVDLN